jgi:hypothetical protein
MSVLKLKPGDLLTLGINEKRVIAFDWRDSFHTGVTITSSVWTITAIKQQDPLGDLTEDNADILNAAEATIALEETVTADSLVTVCRLIGSAANAGDRYLLANKATSSESPNQVKEQSVQVDIASVR